MRAPLPVSQLLYFPPPEPQPLAESAAAPGSSARLPCLSTKPKEVSERALFASSTSKNSCKANRLRYLCQFAVDFVLIGSQLRLLTLDLLNQREQPLFVVRGRILSGSRRNQQHRHRDRR